MPQVSDADNGILGTTTVQVQWNATWRFMQIYSRRLTEGELSFKSWTLRRPL